MVFSSPVFLFLFLPITLGVYYLLPARVRNLWLLVVSLVFYGWGEPKFLVVMLASIACNFVLALWIQRQEDRRRAKFAVGVAVVVNIGLLVVFKYTNFIVDGVNTLMGPLGLPALANPPIALPIGISFFTFHALSYVIDVYRRDAAAQRNPFDMGLYISLFPQLIAGPIIRYHDIAHQLHDRAVTRSMFARGVERFIVGLGKKVLIANTLAVPADLIFSLPPDQLTAPVAWFGVLCYTLQIYFDFSGYSDMAIGLGRMFGFRVPRELQLPVHLAIASPSSGAGGTSRCRPGSATTSTSRWAATGCALRRVYLNLVTDVLPVRALARRQRGTSSSGACTTAHFSWSSAWAPRAGWPIRGRRRCATSTCWSW